MQQHCRAPTNDAAQRTGRDGAGEHPGRSRNPVIKVADIAWLEFEKPDLDRGPRRSPRAFGFTTALRTPDELQLRGTDAGRAVRASCAAAERGRGSSAPRSARCDERRRAQARRRHRSAPHRAAAGEPSAGMSVDLDRPERSVRSGWSPARTS